MYEQFYNLQANPFTLTPDPDYLFLSEEQREAIAGLMYAVLSGRGFSVLIGDAGTGKTTLIRTLMRWIPEARAVFSVIVNPTLTPAEFLRTAIAGFGIDVHNSPKDVLLSRLHRFLLDSNAANRTAVLVADEAHRLSSETLEEIRLLTNFETDKRKLIQVVLAGQDELGDILDRHDLRQLKQRVATRLQIRPLGAESVGAYIRHRWARCATSPPPFNVDAITAIREFSGGIPRLINALCDNALLLGFAQGQRTIDFDLVVAAAADLHLRQGREWPRDTSEQLVHTPLQPTEAYRHHDDRLAPAPTVPSLESYSPRRSWRSRLGLE